MVNNSINTNNHLSPQIIKQRQTKQTPQIIKQKQTKQNKTKDPQQVGNRGPGKGRVQKYI